MIYIVKHKEWNNPVPDGYKELFVGPMAYKNSGIFEPEYQTINHLNPFLNEATGLYDIWKNKTDEIVGLCHYRRFFRFEDDILPFDVAQSLVSHGDRIIVNQRLSNGGFTCSDYCNLMHGGRFVFAKYFKMMHDINPEASNWFINAVKFHPKEMFVCTREVMNKFICEPLFKLMIPLAERFAKEDIHNELVDQRLLGHITERLMSFFFESSGLELVEFERFDF